MIICFRLNCTCDISLLSKVYKTELQSLRDSAIKSNNWSQVGYVYFFFSIFFHGTHDISIRIPCIIFWWKIPHSVTNVQLHYVHHRKNWFNWRDQTLLFPSIKKREIIFSREVFTGWSKCPALHIPKCSIQVRFDHLSRTKKSYDTEFVSLRLHDYKLFRFC